jgi:hypothetical protein
VGKHTCPDRCPYRRRAALQDTSATLRLTLIIISLTCGEKTHIVAPESFAGPMKAKGKTHVCFPNRRLYQPGTSLQAVLAKPQLTLTMPAVITLPASLLVNHRITSTFGTQVTYHTQMT